MDRCRQESLYRVQEPVEALPAPLYAQVSAFAQVPAMAGADQYAFDPAVESTSDEGLLKMANMIDQMANDKQVKQAMQQPMAEPEAAPQEMAEPMEDDFSEGNGVIMEQPTEPTAVPESVEAPQPEVEESKVQNSRGIRDHPPMHLLMSQRLMF